MVVIPGLKESVAVSQIVFEARTYTKNTRVEHQGQRRAAGIFRKHLARNGEGSKKERGGGKRGRNRTA